MVQAIEAAMRSVSPAKVIAPLAEFGLLIDKNEAYFEDLLELVCQSW